MKAKPTVSNEERARGIAERYTGRPVEQYVIDTDDTFIYPTIEEGILAALDEKDRALDELREIARNSEVLYQHRTDYSVARLRKLLGVRDADQLVKEKHERAS